MSLHSRQVIGGLVSPWDIAIRDNLIFADDGVVYHDLQAAIDNADSFVQIGPGTIEANVYVENAGITIEGTGRSSLIDGTNGTNRNGTKEAVRIAAEGVTLRNLSVRSNPADGGTLLNYASAAGENSRRGIVNRVWLRESGDQGVLMQEDDISLTSVIAEDTGGGFAQDVFQSTGGSTDCRLFDVYIMNGAALSDGFNLNGAHHIVGMCEVDTPTNAAFLLTGDKMVISSNLIIGGSTGVDDDGTSNKVEGNTIDGATTGIDAAGATTPEHSDNSIL